jgi:hypothetical protein
MAARVYRLQIWLRWRGPAAIVNGGPVTSSKRAPHIKKPEADSNKNLVLAPDGCLTPTQTGRLTVGHNFEFGITA